jgi:UDP-N-acetyl-D-glucosamine dehydrogenase
VYREAMSFYASLSQKIRNEEAHIVVMGLGYVGLPLAVELAKSASPVTGYDPDEAKVNQLREGVSPIDYPSSETLQYVSKELKFKVTSDPKVLNEADVIIVCVPTPLSKTKEPDLSLVRQALAQIADHQRDGQLIILESTSYPGTTRELAVPALTWECPLGERVFIAYSPERIDPGNPKYNLANTPKLVAGMTPNCAKLAQQVYFKINDDIVPVSSPEVAEMAKVLENTFRAVNIGLANEVALISRKLGIDPFEVIDAAATKPFGFMPFYPGPGLGGHCIPVDPLYLSWKIRSLQGQARFIELADTINSGMPDHVVSVATEALNSVSKPVRGAKVLILGLTYKADVADTRESPVTIIIEKLLELGAEVQYEDPYVPVHRTTVKGQPWRESSLTVSHYGEYDLVIVAAPHKDFDLERVRAESKLIVDTRGVFRDELKRTLKDPKIFRI